MSNNSGPNQSSNSSAWVAQENGVVYVKCGACHGSGQVEIGGWETDCVDCEGYGDFEIPA